MQRVFSIVTGITITEYIRKRRLSLAFEELKLTDNKVIDIAFKYGYDSSISFSRSFKKEFGVTPSKISKDKGNMYKIFPRINFNSKYQNKDIIKYEIKNISGFTIYGKKVIAKTLLTGSEILLFDEVTSSLDSGTTKEIINVMKDLKKDHTIIIITHKEEMMKIADELIILNKGKIVEKGTYKSLIDNKHLINLIGKDKLA